MSSLASLGRFVFPSSILEVSVPHRRRFVQSNTVNVSVLLHFHLWYVLNSKTWSSKRNFIPKEAFWNAKFQEYLLEEFQESLLGMA